MAQELKFRVWDNVDYMSSPFTLQDLQTRKIEFAWECPVMQYSGLSDKTGREIFEGDIVDLGEEVYYQVSCYGGSFVLSHVSTGAAMELLLEKYAEYAEVIGNIYQNKELTSIQSIEQPITVSEIKQTLQSLIDKRLEAMPKYYEGMKSDLDTSEVNDLFLTGVRELVGKL